VLVTSEGIEVLTAHSSDWPSITGHAMASELRRAGALTL
jgi:hypothetical protein